MRGKIVLTAVVFLVGWRVATLGLDSDASCWSAAAAAQERTKGEAKEARRAEPALEALLNQRIDVEFAETPLSDAVAYLQEHSGIQFIINAKKLDEAGVSVDTPLNKTMKRVRLTTVLDVLLDELELAYYEKDELVIITTPEDVESKLLIRVYDCRDLIALDPPELQKRSTTAAGDSRVPPVNLPAGDVPPRLAPSTPTENPAQPTGQPALPQIGGADHSSTPGGGMLAGGHGFPGQQDRPLTDYEVRADSLIDLVVTTVDANTWDRVGGVGAITHYSGLIVITQTSQTHKKVERVLDMLRYAAGFGGPMEENVVR